MGDRGTIDDLLRWAGDDDAREAYLALLTRVFRAQAETDPDRGQSEGLLTRQDDGSIVLGETMRFLVRHALAQRLYGFLSRAAKTLRDDVQTVALKPLEASRMTPEERAKLFERTDSYRQGYDEGKSAGIWIGRLQILLVAGILAAGLAALRYLS